MDKCMLNLLRALEGFSYEIIFVADRCTDSTVEKVRKYEVRMIEKNWGKWVNSYAESLQIGYLKTKGEYIAIIDVDITIPTSFFIDIVPMLKDRIASAAANVVTYPDSLLNQVMYAWEKTYGIAPLGRAPCGAARIILKGALDEINGFRDVPAPDTDIDIRLAREGYKSRFVSGVNVYHIRHTSFGKMISRQINSGRGRYALGVSLVRTIGHAIFRFRPFVVGGWFMEWIGRKSN